MSTSLAKPEVEHDGHEYVDRCPGEATRLEAPLARRQNGLLVESPGVERTNDPNLGRMAVLRHDQFQHDRTLNLTEQRIVRVRRFDLGDHSRWGDRAARSIDAATDPSA